MIYIDPNNVKGKLDYSLFYKESFLLFSVLVAGKNSTMIMKKTNSLISDFIKEDKPKSLFKYIQDNYNSQEIEFLLKKNKTGKYTLLNNFFEDIKNNKINLLNCSLEELENIRGVGKKSSRFFMVYNRADQKDCAILDTHILKFLRANGIEAPEQTPNGKKYNDLEKEFLFLLKSIKPKKTLADLDFEIWYEAKENNKIPIISKEGKLIY